MLDHPGHERDLLCYNQLYLALPVELVRATGSQAALGPPFVLASVMVIAGQVPTTRRVRRIGAGPAIVAGQMIAVPMAQDLVPRPAGERRLGAYYGLLSSAGGLVVLVGSSVTGVLLDPAVAPPVVPWLVLTAVPLAGGAVIAVLRRRGALHRS